MKLRTSRQPIGAVALGVFALVAFGSQWVAAQELKIDTRPLTEAEISNYNMPDTTQKANGTSVVGLGQPVYLDLLVESGTVVTQVVWTLNDVEDVDGNSIAPLSSATITNSPLPMSLPTYDSVDRVEFDVADRAMIVPDVKGTYEVSVEAYTSNGVLQASIEVVGSVYLGMDYPACTLCHASKQEPFTTTLHSVALKDNINDPNGHFRASCIECHSLGYDAAPAAVNQGFDDVAADLGWTFPATLGTNNWDELPDALKSKSNVQCESCHGPAQEHLRSGGDITKIGVSLSAGTCGQCHDAPSHHVKNFEWGNSVHGQTTVDRTGSCVNCHTTAGFINANDPGVNEFGETVLSTNYATFKEGITCAACHDPHAKGQQVHQLRDLLSVTLENGSVVTNGGAGLVCMSCHHARRDAETYVYSNFSSHSGPHHGPQADMLAGQNAIEYGQNMPSSKHLFAVEDSCAHCHMQPIPANLPDYAKGKVGGHSFELAYDDGVNPEIQLTSACQECHGEIDDFNFGGEDYDLDGVVEGVQQEIMDMLDELGRMIPPYGDPSVSASDCDTLALKRAVYNYLFVEEDRSEGVHNPKYASAILRSSIEDLKGGIDVDHDGLVDSWEIANFGDITSQSGKDDFDGDGLSNAQEQNLGTDPTLVDSDDDGISDLIEIQAGSDPMDVNSVPSSDMVILPATEVGYLPQGTGSVVRIQSIDSLSGEGWKDLGNAQTNENGWVYQLDSMRGTTNKFYRAIEE